MWQVDGASLLSRAGAWQRRIAQSEAESRSRAQAGRSARIALALSRGPDLAPIHLAALASGAAIVPVNTSMAVPEVERLLTAAGPGVVVCSRAFAALHRDALERSAAAVVVEEDGACAVSTLTVASCRDSDPALMLFTSGTTGAPKGVPLSHANLRANLVALADCWRRTSDDRLLHMLPAHHLHGLVLGLYGSLLAGGRVHMLPAFDAAAVHRALAHLDINVLMGVPTMYARLLEEAGDGGHDSAATAMARLRLAVCGSAPLPERLWMAFRERFGVALVNRYGLTETGIVASNSIDDPRAGTVGAPLAGTRLVVRLGEERFEAAVPGREGPSGEICVAGPSVTSGYDDSPDANAAAFEGGFFRTGDLGRFDARGDLWIVGRLKELVIVGGSNVIPGEVEAALAGVDGVREMVVAGLPDDDLGEVVGAWIVASPNAEAAALESRLRDAATEALAAYKRPRSYRFCAELPRNAMGKIDKSRLSR